MNLEDQVINLELAKKLKELGVKEEHLFIWTKDYEDSPWYVTSNPLASSLEKDWYYQAYTVAELGEMLSDGMVGSNKTAKSEKGDWRCKYEIIGLSNTTRETFADTEAEARGKMLIYLKENKLI